MLLRSLLLVAGLPMLAAPAGAQPPKAPVTVRDQSDGVNSLRMVTVAAYCRGPAACAGKARLVKGGQTIAQAPFSAGAKETFKTPMRLRSSTFRALHGARNKQLKVTLTVTLTDGQAVSHPVTIHL